MNLRYFASLINITNIKYGFKTLFTKGPSYIINYFKNQESYSEWYEHHQPTEEELARQTQTIFPNMPLISILVPAYHTDNRFLQELYVSIRNQSYSRWELIVADANTDAPEFRAAIQELSQTDTRIKVVLLETNDGISDNTNAALAHASGEYIVLLDHDDTLTPNALYEIVQAINNNSADFIYSDEDKMSSDGNNLSDPYFKPDFNLDMLRSNNYICHLCCIKTTLLHKVGGLRKAFDGAQDYDLILRCCEIANTIYHIPKILYHWRTHQNSTAINPADKQYAYTAGVKALEEHLFRCNISGTVDMLDFPGYYRIQYTLDTKPLISIIIPNKDNTEYLSRCIESILHKTNYDNYEIIIVENNSTDQKTFAYYKEIQKNTKIRILTWAEAFNYSAINNYAVQHAAGEHILLLNNDVEVINSEWLTELVTLSQRPDIGAVGAKLYYSDNTIQHAGVILGIGGIAGHSHKYLNKKYPGYFNRVNIIQNVSAVTGACLMIKKSLYHAVKGLDEDFVVAFNDIDFCMRIQKEGYRNVFTPFAELYHYESKSRGAEDTPEKIQRFKEEGKHFQTRWKTELINGDPYYNPNLTLTHEDFSLKFSTEEPIPFIE